MTPSEHLPDEPPPDSYEWTSEPKDPDEAGMPAEFVNEPGDAVPGVRRDKDAPAPADFDQESNN
jgi:hypothetical protein